MATERDKHIQKLMERAAQEKTAQRRTAPVQRKAAGQARNAVSEKKTVAPARPIRKPIVPQAAPAPTPRSAPKQSTATPAKPTRPVRPSSPVASKKPEVRTPTKKAAPSIVTNEDKQIAISLVLIFIAIYLIISSIGYFMFWDIDQSIASSWRSLITDQLGEAQNWGGRLGALLSNELIGNLFGVSGILLPIAILLGALHLLPTDKLKFAKALPATLILMILGSLAFGNFAGINPAIFGTGLGGEMGIMVTKWMQQYLGFEGTSLLIVLALGSAIYFSLAKWFKTTVKNLAQAMDERRLKREELRQSKIERNRAIAAETNLRTRELARIEAERLATATMSKELARAKDVQANEQPEESINKSELIENHDTPTQQLLINQPEWMPNSIVELDNGQNGYLAGFDALGTPIIYHYIAPEPIILDSDLWQEVTENDQDETPEIEFIIKHRPQEELFSEPAIESIPFHIQSENKQEPQDIAFHIQEPKLESIADTTNSSTAPVNEGNLRVVHFAPSKDDPNFIVEQYSTDETIDNETINLTELYDPTLELRNYQKPPVELLHDHSRKVTVTEEELFENKNRIVGTLENFGIKISSIEATVGPTVTLYEIIPAPGVRISKIKNLEDDIALSLSALGIRIIAPIPGKGTIGIEVPNKEKETVSMYSVIKSARFHDSTYDLPIALGKTIQNETYVVDLAKMPHLLVAGATGQGKSVGLNAIITSLLYKKHPAELKFILIDPKKVELTLYQRLEKHFLAKLPDSEEAIITDNQKVIYTLNSVCIEMDARYELLKSAKVRHIKEYNEKFVNRRLNPEKGHRYLPYFVIIVDEFADLIMTAGREVETPIARIAQLARAVGIHLIIATQRPSVNIITGVIRANFPARIAFRVTTATDSRTILDGSGANQLIGRGDMLISTGSEIVRVQCAFIDTPEVELITEHIGRQKGYPTAYELPEYVPEGEASNGISNDDTGRRDSLFDEVARYVVSNQSGSASTIQRKFSIGFNRAGRIVDQLEAAGIVGRSEGSKPRQVLISDPISLEMILDHK